MTVPAPAYVDNAPRPADNFPAQLGHDERVQARTAASRALQRYPGAVGTFLAKELEAYEELGRVCMPSSPMRRVIAELLRPA